jgi:histidine ammonia-lyase
MSLDSIPTSASQEDHVSMVTYASRRLHDMVENSAYAVAIELLATIGTLSFRLCCKGSNKLEKILPCLSPLIALKSSDYVLSPEIKALQ